MDYKATLNLPKTDFPMKADLPKREPVILKQWDDMDLYGKIRAGRKGQKKFILHDGPPYANGNIHMGHALNKILKDIVIRYKTMRGFDSPYIPGWDCHGLPVEHQLFKELKMTKYDIDQVKFRHKAHDYAMKYVAIQRDGFKRLGILGDWGRPYLTLLPKYEAAVVRSFGTLVEKGYIYRDLKPVNWCATCETALAEAEVEYEDKLSPSIYVKFKLMQDSKTKDLFAQYAIPNTQYVFFVIWTTTPWTLLANVAIALHPDTDYVTVAVKEGTFRGQSFIIAKQLLQVVMEKAVIKDYTVLKTVKGKEFDGLVAQHPFIDRQSKVVMAEYVSMEEGTGCVHTAPGHGQDDYLTGKRYGLPTIMPVDHKGTFDDTAGEFSGMFVYKANAAIVDTLKQIGSLVGEGSVTHSYPHCWRCKKPIIFRATEQYFLNVDHNGLRKEMLAAIGSSVQWIPEMGKARISAMVENRPDWCLSRQRYWGVPIIAFLCVKCKKVLLDAPVIAHVASLIEKEGADVWFSKKAEELLPKGTSCGTCGGSEFEKEDDIIDVWFDSGVSHQAVLKHDKDLDYPCALYLEGSDQHRGWFQSALITSMAIDNAAPYRGVLTHGFVVDGEGRKMSKSQGNVIMPDEVMKRYGADILRLWVASSDYAEDVRISEVILTRLADAYRKMRNTYKYLLSNLYDYDPEKDAVPNREMSEIDRWVLSRLAALIKACEANYDAYAFHKVYRDIYSFCTFEISSIYADVLKDRMYTYKANSKERRSGQTAMHEVLVALLRIAAPIVSITTDEAWGYVKTPKKEASIHLEPWPESFRYEKWRDEPLEKRWRTLVEVREAVLKKLEERRQAQEIGSGLEAKVTLSVDGSDFGKTVRVYEKELRYLFIVSEVKVEERRDSGPGEGGLPLAVRIEKAEGAKCQRCWNYSRAVGTHNDHPTLCERCVSAV